MSIFSFYLKLGITHILNLEALDHILFIAALVAVYMINDWKKIIFLATAFTIGHTTTLALATLNIIRVPSALIEFLIAATIFLTGFGNLFKIKEEFSKPLHNIKYLIAMFFGLIHGMGFSNTLRYMLGMEQNLWKPLLAFNIGIEIGQIILITIFLTVEFILVRYLRVKQREWNLVLSGMAMGVSLLMMLERYSAAFS